METKTYYFHPGKASVKQGYLMENDNQEVVYEANVLKQPLFGAADVEFVNHITGKSEIHKVGHTVTSETSAGKGSGFVLTSRFALEVTTSEEFIDWAFLVAYSIAKTEQTFYS